MKHKLGNLEKSKKSLEIGEKIVTIKKELITQEGFDEGAGSSVEKLIKI